MLFRVMPIMLNGGDLATLGIKKPSLSAIENRGNDLKNFNHEKYLSQEIYCNFYYKI